jgi:hypothetical protein
MPIDRFIPRSSARNSLLPSVRAFTRIATFALLWTVLPVLRSQTIQNFKIDPDPVTVSGTSYDLGARSEKVVDFFTSTTIPSVVLAMNGSDGSIWLYQSSGGLNGWGANPTPISYTLGAYYERAKSIRLPGRSWPDLVVSAPGVNGSGAGSTILFLNPLNPGGNGNPSEVWQQVYINANSGCHDIKLADMNNDGLLDVICSGAAFLPGSEPFIAYQTSNISVWNVVNSTVTQINLGDGVGVWSYNGINNVIGSSGSSTYIWENPLNFGGNPLTQVWPNYPIGPGATGNALGNLPNNMGVIVADSEEGTGEPPWTYGLVQFSPPASNVFSSAWKLTEIDDTVRTAHEIIGGTLPWNSEVFVSFAEQEQRSAHCNIYGYFSAPDIGACRVGYYTYSTGAWSSTPVIFSTYGTHNQSLINYNGSLLVGGANFGTAGAIDTSLQLWDVTNGSGEQNAPTPQISPASGTYSTPQQVTITDTATNPTIYYTIDGSMPTTSSPKYTAAFTISATTTVQAIATASGYLQSAVASATYTIQTGGNPTPLSPGTYTIKNPSTGDTMDLGWALNPQWGYPTYIYLYNYYGTGTQQITYTTSGQLQSVSNPADYLFDDGGALALGSTGDTFSIISSGSGYTIYDSTAGLYVNSPGKLSPPNQLILSSTPTIWNALLQ